MVFDIKRLILKIISKFLCRYKNVQDFFVIGKQFVDLSGFDSENRHYHDIDNEDDFRKICKKYNFTIDNADIKQRFAENAHFCVITEGDHYGCWGWYRRGADKLTRPFYILEIEKRDVIPDDVTVLFHYYSNPEYRRKGYYFDLLRNIAMYNGSEYSVIYSYDTNPISALAIQKAGFKFIGRLSHKTFNNFKTLIECYNNNKICESSRKKEIMFFIESLDGGGAEGALENIVTNLDKDRFDITVVSETDRESRTDRIAKASRYHCFGHKNVNNSLLREIINRIIFKFSWSAPPSLVRKVLVRGKYDIEVAGCEGYATKIIGSSKDKNSVKIAWVHTDFVNNPWSVSVFGSAAEERACYEKFDKIICVSETIKESFIKTYGMEEKVQVLHNIIDNHRIQELGKVPLENRPECPLFVMAGSFLRVKGYERAVRAFARLRDEGYDFQVIIMGIGYERASVEAVIEETDMEHHFTLMDYQPNPYKYMAAADAYVCSSYAEGYSTTVTESVILGKPIITTECSGMREIFGDRRCGIICENSDEGLLKALRAVLAEPELLKKYAEESKIRSNYFSKESLVSIVEDFFEKA